jgi:hypothetical protein
MYSLLKPFFIHLVFTSLTLAVDLPIVVDPATPLTGTYSVEWNTPNDFETWITSSPQITCASLLGPDLDLGFNDYLELRIRVPASHTGDIKIFYGTSATTGFSSARVLMIPDALVPADGAFHTYRIDVGLEPWWRANLRNLRIEPTATSGQAFAIDALGIYLVMFI